MFVQPVEIKFIFLISFPDIMNNMTEDEIKQVSKEIADFMYQMHSLKYDEKEIFKTDNIGFP